MLGRLVAFVTGWNISTFALCFLLLLPSAYFYLGTIQAHRQAEALQLTLAQERLDRAREREELTAAAFKASERLRQMEAFWRAKHDEVQANAEAKTRASERNAARARDASDLLRKRADIIAALCSGATPGSSTALAASGQAGSSPGAVLTYVLGRLENAGRELAEIADARATAGVACQTAYDALR